MPVTVDATDFVLDARVGTFGNDGILVGKLWFFLRKKWG